MKIRAFFNEVECESLEYLGGTEELTLPLPGEIESGICKLKFAVPLKDIQQYWLPRTEGLCNRLSWTFEHRCGAQSGFPLVSFSSRDGYNRFTFGLDDLVDDTRIYAEINQAECTYDITVEIACCNETPEIRLYLDDDAEMLWTASIEQYRLWLEQGESFAPVRDFPEAAWQPVFCTWYAVHGAVDASWVERIAPRARSLGFGTLIVDDGWCYPEYKRLSPETLPSWYQDIGDWQVDATKFPDMPAHVKRVKAMGLNYLVWTTAMLWGKNSRRLQEHPEAVTARPEDCGCRQFDVRHEEVGEEIAERLGALVAENGLDGLKVDFVDHLANDPRHPNGCESMRLVRAISDAIRKAKPDALIEFRQNYCTPQMLAFATQFRAMDAPFDYILNFERCVQIRLCLGDNVPVHADPAYWAPNETPENIARHFIAMMVGVPMLSMDLEKLPIETMKLIRHWMNFYAEHQELLNHGHWEFGFNDGNCSWATVNDEEEAIVILRDRARLDEATDYLADGTTITVLNLAPGEVAIQEMDVQVFDCGGKEVEQEEPDGIAFVPAGGYAQYVYDDFADDADDEDAEEFFDDDEEEDKPF